MADGIFVPPHLQIDPLRPVQFYLQGTSTGVGAAEARNRAQAAAMELAQRAAAQQAANERAAMAAQAANERAAMAAQADAAQTAARIQDLQQQRELNEQKAAVMAKRYAASNSIRDAIARGVPPAEAAYMFPDFYLESPAAFTSLTRPTSAETPSAIEKNIRYVRQLNPAMTDEQASKMAQAQMMGQRMKMRSLPGGGFEFEQGMFEPGTAPTMTQQSRIQDDLRNSRESINLMEDLQKNLNWKDVGIAGVVGEWVGDRLLPQFGVKSADSGRMDKRTKMKTLVQGLLRQISPDNRFTENDFRRVAEIGPSSGLLETEERAKTSLKVISDIFAERNIRDRTELGQNIPSLLSSLSNAEVAAAYRMGVISYDQAYKILEGR